MKKGIIKRIIALAVVMSCLVGMMGSVNAHTITFGAYPSIGYSNNKVSITYTNRTSYLSSVSFVGITPGAFPYHKYVAVSLYASNTSNETSSTTALHYSLGNKSLTANNTGSYYIGAYTNASIGATIGVTV